MCSRSPSRYRFARDPTQGYCDLQQHGVRFESALTLLDDVLSMSRQDETRTMGAEEELMGDYRVHEGGGAHCGGPHFEERDGHPARVRIISARHPTRDERQQYISGQYRIREPDMSNEYEMRTSTIFECRTGQVLS